MVCGTSNHKFIAFLIVSWPQANTTKTHLPHIPWCTTGPLSLLPLHAVGSYSTLSMIFNYVVSSYTTLSALLSPDTPSNAFSGIITVGQKSTLGLWPLLGMEIEPNHIQEILSENLFFSWGSRGSGCRGVAPSLQSTLEPGAPELPSALDALDEREPHPLHLEPLEHPEKTIFLLSEVQGTSANTTRWRQGNTCGRTSCNGRAKLDSSCLPHHTESRKAH